MKSYCPSGPRACALMVSAAFVTSLVGPAAFAKPQLKELLRGTPILKATAPVNPVAKPTPAPMIPSLYRTQFSDNQVNQCIESMCGPASTNWGVLNSLIVRINTFTDDFKKLWQGEVGPNLAIAIQADQDATAKTVDRLETLIKQGKTPQLGHPMEAVVVYQILSANMISPNLDALLKIDKKTFKATVNQDNLKLLQSKIGDPATEAAVALLLKKVFVPELNQAIAEQLAGATQNKLASRLTVRYPQMSSAQALKTDGLAINQLYDQLKSKLGILTLRQFVDDIEVVLFTRAASGKDLNKVDSDLYVAAAQGVEKAAVLLDGEVHKALMKVTVDVTSGLREIKQNGLIAKKRADLATHTAKSRFEKIATECAGRLNLALSSTATPQQYIDLHSRILTIKSVAKSMMPRLVSAAAVPVASDAIDHVAFMLPESVSDYTAIVEDAIASVDNSAVENLNGLANPSNDFDQVLLWTAPFVLSTNESAEPLTDACERLPIDSITDYTLTAQGKIAISWFTAAYPDVGVGIVAHEMGHVVSTNLRKLGTTAKENAPKFLSMLNCVANRNPFVTKTVSLGYNDNTTWSEEDWADHFSDLVMNDLHVQKSPLDTQSRDMGCALLNDDGKAYTDNSIQPASGDIHSAPLFRLIIMGIDKRKQVPAQCQKFLSYSGLSHRQLNCE